MARYVVLNSEGNADNVIVWNHDTEWSPPEGCTIVPEDSDEGQTALAARAAAAEAEQAALLASQKPQ